MTKKLKRKQPSKKQFSQGQDWAANQNDPRLQYLSRLKLGSPLRVLDLNDDDHDNSSYLGLKPSAKRPVVVEHGGRVLRVAVSDVLKADADEDRGLLPGGEMLCVAQPLAEAELNRIRQCDHDWVVCSTAMAEVWLILTCLCCGAHGSVDDPSADEWDEAFHAPTDPYKWSDKSRVTVRGRLVDADRHILPFSRHDDDA